ncbi:glucose sorbosone dehydrogenase [Nocardiopsis gilva YIM 90087]|uniref:Glucose sorbosone dehydrogenase n=1 Tax=Nocardiopsis gilva YIM 90087 TaxID=1235441 RepID=A0A223SAL5_9ACTN|nr:PQQ-dependent sugar dehydrogenase [Nocardiopsis gilva]ASU85172.1 glucose sorbosone dehydrogenase [Nocardiopsis gilva YIM 90087]
MRCAFDRTRSRAAVMAVALMLAAACADGESGRPDDTGRPAETSDGGGPTATLEEREKLTEPVDVATDLEVPWDIAFLPDGAALVTERDSARIVRVEPGGEVTEVGTVDAAAPRGEGGLLGLAVHPHYPADPAIYVYVTAADDNRILRMSYAADSGLGEPEVVLDGIPKAAVHNGGRIAFGPDGLLYASTGDATEGSTAQDTGSLGGKILRMTPDGKAPDDNPFGNLVYSYGHRNVQGLAWDDEGRLFATEFGQDTYDEINVIEPGDNYGWPEVEGIGGDDRYTEPVVVWRPAEASPSGGAIAGGALWVAALRGERLWKVPLTGDADDPVGDPEALYVERYGRLRSVTTAPGGTELWVGTSNRDGRGSPASGDDRILRVPTDA